MRTAPELLKKEILSLEQKGDVAAGLSERPMEDYITKLFKDVIEENLKANNTIQYWKNEAQRIALDQDQRMLWELFLTVLPHSENPSFARDWALNAFKIFKGIQVEQKA